MRRTQPQSTARSLAADCAALLVFVTIGLVSHHHGFARGYARDLPAFAGCWLGAALVFGLYRREGAWRLPATWALGVPLAVLVRALIVGHALNGSEGAFLVVSLATIAFLVLLFRRLASLKRPSPRAPRDST